MQGLINSETDFRSSFDKQLSLFGQDSPFHKSCEIPLKEQKDSETRVTYTMYHQNGILFVKPDSFPIRGILTSINQSTGGRAVQKGYCFLPESQKVMLVKKSKK